jgi:hypothetical protein
MIIFQEMKRRKFVNWHLLTLGGVIIKQNSYANAINEISEAFNDVSIKRCLIYRTNGCFADDRCL